MNTAKQNASIIRTMEVNALLRHADMIVEKNAIRLQFSEWNLTIDEPKGDLENYRYQMTLKRMASSDALDIQFSWYEYRAFSIANWQTFAATMAEKGLHHLTYNH